MMTPWAEMCWRCSCQEKENGGRPKMSYLDVVKEVGTRVDEVFV